VAQREWNDLVSYHPELPPALHRVERDEQFIENLAAAVTAFAGVLEEQYAVCVSRGWVREKKQPQPFEREPTLSEMVRDALIEANGRRKESE